MIMSVFFISELLATSIFGKREFLIGTTHEIYRIPKPEPEIILFIIIFLDHNPIMRICSVSAHDLYKT